MKRRILFLMVVAVLLGCQSTPEGASPTGTVDPATTGMPCSELGEMCGGLRGIVCCSGLICDYGPGPMYPDKSGVCVEHPRPLPDVTASAVSAKGTPQAREPVTVEGVILTVMTSHPRQLAVEIRPGERYHVALSQDTVITREGQAVRQEELIPGMRVRMHGLWVPGGRDMSAEVIDILP